MRILVDVDDVLADMLIVFEQHLSAMGVEIKPPHERPGTFELESEYGITTAMKKAVFRCIDISTLPAFPDAIDFIYSVTRRHEVYFVTSYIEGIPLWKHHREKWLREHFQSLSTRVVHTKHKHLISGDVLIDDCLRNVFGWLQEHPTGTAFVPPKSWNRYIHREGGDIHKRIIRTNSWADIEQEIERLSHEGR